jgi:predicted hotdog family 3-hydroxylacyl-ACP dehydratase
MSSMILGTRLTKGYQQITSLSSATVLTVPTDARIALIQAEDQSVRWRDDGVDPTTTVGMLMPSTVVLEYDGQLANLRFIEVTASAKLNVSYYG